MSRFIKKFLVVAVSASLTATAASAWACNGYAPFPVQHKVIHVVLPARVIQAPPMPNAPMVEMINGRPTVVNGSMMMGPNGPVMVSNHTNNVVVNGRKVIAGNSPYIAGGVQAPNYGSQTSYNAPQYQSNGQGQPMPQGYNGQQAPTQGYAQQAPTQGYNGQPQQTQTQGYAQQGPSQGYNGQPQQGYNGQQQGPSQGYNGQSQQGYNGQPQQGPSQGYNAQQGQTLPGMSNEPANLNANPGSNGAPQNLGNNGGQQYNQTVAKPISNGQNIPTNGNFAPQNGPQNNAPQNNGPQNNGPVNLGAQSNGSFNGAQNAAIQAVSASDPNTANVPAEDNSAAGQYTATISQNASVVLNLQADGTFNWSASNNGKSSSFAGNYTIDNGTLSLMRTNDNQKLEGAFTPAQNGFNFKPRDAKDAGLNFVRG
ncbi:MAG TPA: hypothetical protein VFE24_08730 [Pirellulales bacterium]|jgi:hypothetical protein|nr:hypothetical protein [Pirellulales bacterium]